MRYLLDTCVISELTKERPEKKVIQWLEKQRSYDLFLSVITIGELMKGIEKLEQSKKKALLRGWLDTLISEYNDRILLIDLDCVISWALMTARAEKKGLPLSAIDSLIAAQASYHELTIVTRNIADFKASCADIFNPWDQV